MSVEVEQVLERRDDVVSPAASRMPFSAPRCASWQRSTRSSIRHIASPSCEPAVGSLRACSASASASMIWKGSTDVRREHSISWPRRRPPTGYRRALGLERRAQLHADAATRRVVRIDLVQRLEECLDSVGGERRGRIFRGRRLQRERSHPRARGSSTASARSCAQQLEQRAAGLGVFVAEAVDEPDAEVENGADELDGGIAQVWLEHARGVAPNASAA